jgi:hypothetical protein
MMAPDSLPDGKTLFSRQVMSIGKHRVIYRHIPFYSELHTSSKVQGWVIDLASRLDEGSIAESMQFMTKVGPEVCSRHDIFLGTGAAVFFADRDSKKWYMPHISSCWSVQPSRSGAKPELE